MKRCFGTICEIVWDNVGGADWHKIIYIYIYIYVIKVT